MTVWYKQGVLGDLQPKARKAIGIIASLNSMVDIYITSLRDGNHSAGSLHYDGLAFDMRNPEPQIKIADIKSHLGPNYDIVVEPNHIHIEYDPKEK